MKIGSLVGVLILLGAVTVHDQPNPRVHDRINWSEILKIHELIRKPADQNDMEQIQARLALAAACQLAPNDLEIAVARAQKPDMHFGIRNMDGLRWIMSAQVVAEYDQCQRITILEQQLAALKEEMEKISK